MLSPTSALVLLYTASLLLWQIVGLTPLAGWWLIDLANVFHVWFYLPLPFLALLVAWRREWQAGAWLLLPLLLLALDYGPLFLPRGGRGEGAALRVMTANLLWLNDDAEAVAQAMLDQAPDLIAVQELGGGIAGPLAQRLRARYPYQALHPAWSTDGMGLFSRYPLRAQSMDDSPGACRCQQATMDFGRRAVTLLNAHPARFTIRPEQGSEGSLPFSLTYSEQQRTLADMLEKTDELQEPGLLLGDLNLVDHQRPYRRLAHRLRDAHREVGWGLGYTFPARRFYSLPLPPLIRIDYVFYDYAWTASSAWTVEIPGSDHRAVVADLVLKAP